MTEIMETVLFMLAVLAAVAVAAQRLNTAPSILLVVAGIGMALIPDCRKSSLHRNWCCWSFCRRSSIRRAFR